MDVLSSVSTARSQSSPAVARGWVAPAWSASRAPARRWLACARRKDVLERATDAIRRATGAEILAMAADVTHGEEVEAFVAATVAQFGGVDILVNNAGTSLAAGFEQVDEATWQYDFDLKVMGAIRLCRPSSPT